MKCFECNQEMMIDENEVSYHLTEDEEIDYDADLNHVPYFKN